MKRLLRQGSRHPQLPAQGPRATFRAEHRSFAESIDFWSLEYVQDFVDWRSGSLARSIQAGQLRCSGPVLLSSCLERRSSTPCQTLMSPFLDAPRSDVFQLREAFRLGDLAAEGVFTRCRSLLRCRIPRAAA